MPPVEGCTTQNYTVLIVIGLGVERLNHGEATSKKIPDSFILICYLSYL